MNPSNRDLVVVGVDDPSVPRSWSGTPWNIIRSLEDLGWVPRTIHVTSPPTIKALSLVAITSGQAGKGEWRRTWIARTANARRARRVISQMGSSNALHMGSLTLPSGPVPWRNFCFLDSTLRQWAEGSIDSNFGSPTTLQRFDRLEKARFRHVEAFFVVSEATATSLTRDYGVPRERVHVTGTGLGFPTTPEPKQSGYGDGQLLYVARQRFGDKGADLVREAFDLAVAKRPHLKLTVIGGGHYFSPATPGVKVLSRLQHEELIQEFRNASLFVMPARNEPWGLVYLEAMALAVPVLGLRRNALPELTNYGGHGYLVDDASAPSIADAIVRATDNADELRLKGAAARRYVLERYTWQRVAKTIITRLSEHTSS